MNPAEDISAAEGTTGPEDFARFVERLCAGGAHNISDTERIASGVAGALLASRLSLRSILDGLVGIVALGLLYRAVTGHCPVRQALDDRVSNEDGREDSSTDVGGRSPTGKGDRRHTVASEEATRSTTHSAADDRSAGVPSSQALAVAADEPKTPSSALGAAKASSGAPSRRSPVQEQRSKEHQ